MTLLEEARGLIKAHLASKPHLSIASMARACGIPPTTARTIIQGEVKKTSRDNIVGLLATFMEFDEINALVSKYEDKDSIGAAHISILTQRKAKLVAPEALFEYENPDQNILALASSSNGVSRERIMTKYGEFGLKRVELLMTAGLLREINNRIKQPDECVYYPLRDTQQKVKRQAESWKPEDTENGGFIYHLTQNYTLEAHEEALEAIKQCIVKLSELERKNKHGDKVVMISFIGNLLDGEQQ